MSDQQANPAAELDENSIGNPDDTNPQGQGGDETPDEAALAAQQEVARQEEETQKQSRFQRQRATYEAKLADEAREKEYWRNLALNNQGKPPVQTAPEDNEPKLEDFDGQGIDAFLKAHTTWVQRQVLQQARVEAQRQTEVARIQATLESRVNATKKEISDWDEVIASSEVPAEQDTAEFLVESDIGPKIAYHLAKFPDEHERLNKMSHARRMAELGKLEDRLSTKAPVAEKRNTSAPSKMTQVKGTANVNVDPGTAARTGGYKAWKAAQASRT